MELNLFIEKLFEGAKAAGYEAAEIACLKGDSFDVSVKGGEIIDYNVASTLDFTFRALVNGKMGYLQPGDRRADRRAEDRDGQGAGAEGGFARPARRPGRDGQRLHHGQ